MKIMEIFERSEAFLLPSSSRIAVMVASISTENYREVCTAFIIQHFLNILNGFFSIVLVNSF